MGPFSCPKDEAARIQSRLQRLPTGCYGTGSPPQQPTSSLRLDKRDSTDGATDMDLSIKLEPKASSVEISD